MKLRFLSSNSHKLGEVRLILEPLGLKIVSVHEKIDEIQTTDVVNLVRDKCIKAFQKVGHPIFVEHTGLRLAALNGFPGGLTQIFWDTLQADRVAELFGRDGHNAVTAHTQIGFCDGRSVHQFEGEIKGVIAPEPEGNRDFQWDCVFIPQGYSETFACMGQERKNEISMRRIALNAFAKYLEADVA
jgi:XTP/dITP diphosphohydrolase